MGIASGVAKSVRYKVEATYGTAPGASGGQLLRRVTSDLGLTKDTYQSNEIRSDYQVADFRHGIRRVGGSLKGELSPKTYADFFAAALRKDFAAVTAIPSLSLTIAGSGPYTITRSAGSWLSDGVKVGHVVRLTAGSFNTGNSNKNVLVTGLTATVITGIVLNASSMVAEGPIASATLTIVGKQTYVPTTGHADKSFYVEHWFSDIAQSEQFSGVKINTVDISLPPTGISEISLGLMGKDLASGTSAYYTSPTAATSTGVVAAVNGAVLINGAQVAVITGMSIKIDGGYSGDPVVGANTVPNVFPGRVRVTGSFTAYFQDAVMRDYFVNETEISIVAAFTTSNDAAADFITFVLPRVKVGSATKDDGEKGIIQSFDFVALYNSAGGPGTSSEATTLFVQDSQA